MNGPRRLMVAALASIGCGTSSPAVPDAALPDAAADAPAGGDADASLTILPYPPGPYGNATGDTMPDFYIEGYPLSRTQRDYTQLPFRDIALSEVRSDPSCTCVVVIWNASGWSCPWCVMEDVSFSSAMAVDPGLCGVEVLAFDYDAVPNGSTPSRADLDDWVSANRESFPVGLSTPNLDSPLSLGTQFAVPTAFVLRASDMRFAGVLDGVGDNVGAQARALCETPKPAVATLATGLAPTALRIDDSHAYVLDDVSGLFRVPLGGGAAEVVAAASVAPSAFVLDAKNVYFAAVPGTGHAIEQIAKSGGAPVVLDSSTSAFTDVAVDSSYVYASRADGVVERVPIGGGSAQPLVSGEADPGGLALDDTTLFFIARGTGEIAAVPKSGGPRASVVPPGGLVIANGNVASPIPVVPTQLLMGAGELYVNGRLPPSALPEPSDRAGAVIVLKSGAPPAPILAGPETSIALSPIGVFLGLACSTGPYCSVPQGSIVTTADVIGPNVTTLSLGQPWINAVAGDDTYAYWTVGESAPGAHDGALRRIHQ